MASKRRLSLCYAGLEGLGENIRQGGKTVIVLVGLPARGKSYIASKLTRYLNWVGILTKVFNAGAYRRSALNSQDETQDADYFSSTNQAAKESRGKFARLAFNDLLNWLIHDNGEIGVFDATNSTRERRQWLMDSCTEHELDIIFVESICSNAKVIEDNVKLCKVRNSDYQGVTEDAAFNDFIERMKNYEKQYETIDDDLDQDWPYIKIFDQGQRYLVNRIEGNVRSRIVYCLMNMRVQTRTIFLCRHGEAEFNVKGRIGGNTDLTERGLQFARKLGKFMSQQNITDLKIWTSDMRRSHATGRSVQNVIPGSQLTLMKALDELDAGKCDGLTYQEIEETYPEDFANRAADKYNYRYPMGESYKDLVNRLEPVIMELERQSSVLVVCHQAVMRCLLAYFQDKSPEELPYLKVPLHHVFKMTPLAYNCCVEDLNLMDKPDTIPLTETGKEMSSHSSFESLQTVPAQY